MGSWNITAMPWSTKPFDRFTLNFITFREIFSLDAVVNSEETLYMVQISCHFGHGVRAFEAEKRKVGIFWNTSVNQIVHEKNVDCYGRPAPAQL